MKGLNVHFSHPNFKLVNAPGVLYVDMIVCRFMPAVIVVVPAPLTQTLDCLSLLRTLWFMDVCHHGSGCPSFGLTVATH